MIRVSQLFGFVPLLFLLISATAHAGIETHIFDDKEKEGLYKDLITELRCLVCQNQNLAESNAELALDLRQQTYDMIQAGSSKSDVVDYMVQRYGDFVLYRPPFQASTLLLWIGPFIFLLFALLGLIKYIRGRTRATDPEMSSEDLDRAKQLLSQNRQD